MIQNFIQSLLLWSPRTPSLRSWGVPEGPRFGERVLGDLHVHVQVRQTDPTHPEPGGHPQARRGGPPPQDRELPRGSPGPRRGGARPGPQSHPQTTRSGGHPGGPDGPPEGPKWSRLRVTPGPAEKVGLCGSFSRALKVRPGRNHLAFRIFRQLTH